MSIVQNVPVDIAVNRSSLTKRLADVFLRSWDLGFIGFGGPPVHFQILHRRFVQGISSRGKSDERSRQQRKWVDEQTYQELFALCQGLPGPGSTKMGVCLALVHAGIVPAIFYFLIWSLPGAIGMYGLSLGVQRIGETLPAPVYALLTGLNASTVGIVALAAVQLATAAIKDKLTRILVIMGACAGLCYNALWYFPMLMVIGGVASVTWDCWLQQRIGKMRARFQRRKAVNAQDVEEVESTTSVPLEDSSGTKTETATQRRAATPASRPAEAPVLTHAQRAAVLESSYGMNTSRSRVAQASTDTNYHAIPVKWGLSIIAAFFATFTIVLVVRGTLSAPSRALDLFANMYLAGTIIFGGGPVVIPLLRSYVSSSQYPWVSPRDFLLGLAIIQAFPGPNFNFGVYLGALALQNSQFPTIFGAFLGFIGIFAPGIILGVGVQSLWRVLRTKAFVVSALRGINATAVGLVFTAVYRLWEIGNLTSKNTQGQSLALNPWWVVVTALAYAETAWFKIPPAAAICFGGVLGLCWYGAVGRS